MRYRNVKRRLSKHKTFLMILVGILIAYVLVSNSYFYSAIDLLKDVPLIGALIAGFFFSSALTTAPSLTVLYFLASGYNPFLIALFGAIGAVIADISIYKYVVSGVVEEIEHDFKWIAKLERYRNKGIYKTILPIIGGIIIASPFPDELGIALLGSKKINPWKFAAISFVANFIGILIVASLAQ